MDMKDLIRKILKEEINSSLGTFYLVVSEDENFKDYDWVPSKERFDRFVEYDDGWTLKVVNNRIINDEDFTVGDFYRIKFWRDRWFDIKIIDKKLEYGNHYRYKYETVNPEESAILFRHQNNQEYGFLTNRSFYEKSGTIKAIKPISEITQNYRWGGYPYEDVYILGYYTINKDINDYDSELITTSSISIIGVSEFIDLTSEPPKIDMVFDLQELSSTRILQHFNNDNTIYFNEDFETTKFYYVDGITEGNLTLITKDIYEKYYNSIIRRQK